MNISYFIAKRIRKPKKGSFSSVIHQVAIVIIGLGLAVMIVSFLILDGFKKNISNKIYSFSGHLQITKYTLNSSYEQDPISLRPKLKDSLLNLDYVEHIQSFAFKPALVKANQEIQGIILKGVGNDYDTGRFIQNMVAGRFIHLEDNKSTDEVIISKRIANQLRLRLGDGMLFYFVQNPPRYRKLKVVGMYDTGMENLDDKLVISDLMLVQKLNNWEDGQVGGFEIFLYDPKLDDHAYSQLLENVDYDMILEKTRKKYYGLFGWLELINRNVIIFLVIILFVASVNMVSILLILVMERVRTIGILKAMGASNNQIRNVFLINSLWLIVRGLFMGNIIGLGFGWLQKEFKLLELDPESYFMYFVPIHWSFGTILLLNLLTLVVVSLTLLIPSSFISRIRPVEAIRFE